MAKKNVKGAKGPTPHRESLVVLPIFFRFGSCVPPCRFCLFVVSLLRRAACVHQYRSLHYPAPDFMWSAEGSLGFEPKVDRSSLMTSDGRPVYDGRATIKYRALRKKSSSNHISIFPSKTNAFIPAVRSRTTRSSRGRVRSLRDVLGICADNLQSFLPHSTRIYALHLRYIHIPPPQTRIPRIYVNNLRPFPAHLMHICTPLPTSLPSQTARHIQRLKSERTALDTAFASRAVRCPHHRRWQLPLSCTRGPGPRECRPARRGTCSFTF